MQAKRMFLWIGLLLAASLGGPCPSVAKQLRKRSRLMLKLKDVHRSVLLASVIVALGVLPAIQARGDFVLRNDEQLTVSTDAGSGTMYDRSQLYVLPNGYVSNLETYNSSRVNIEGGQVGKSFYAYDRSTMDLRDGYVNSLYAYDSSALNLRDGEITSLRAYDTSAVEASGGSTDSMNGFHSSTVNFSGGEVQLLKVEDSGTMYVSGGSVAWRLSAWHNSTLDLSGGSVRELYVCNNSTVRFHARDFRLGAGLSLDGDELLGTGVLSGEWFDGTPWVTVITANDSTATLRLVPEPAMFLVLALGGLGLLLRRRRNGRRREGRSPAK